MIQVCYCTNTREYTHFPSCSGKLVNKLNKAALLTALLTKCYVQHFLSPYIDSEVNHKRHFIKLPFIKVWSLLIYIYSIFKDNLVISSIQNINKSETPIICYTIRSTIFNFNKIVSYKDIDSNTLDS